jgi:hypothetical protein
VAASVNSKYIVQLFGVFRRVLILLSFAVSVAQAAGERRMPRNKASKERITTSLRIGISIRLGSDQVA